MDFKLLRGIASSTTPYKIAMVIAVFLLLFIAGINYTQIKSLQTSAEWVSHSLRVDKEINNLFSQYSLMESAEFRAVILRDSTFAESYIDYKLESDNALQRLYKLTKDIPEHRVSLDSVTYFKDSLHVTLTALHGKIGPSVYDSSVVVSVRKAAELLKKIRGLKTKMILKKDALLQERLAAYNRQTTLTPITSLLLALFSLGVFTLAFMRIRWDKNQIEASATLLQHIVQSTDNIMNYYEPIVDANNDVIDFKIIFANDCNRDYLGLDPQNIVGQPISKVFPFTLLNGELDEMIAAFKNSETIAFERQVGVKGEKLWFHSIIKPLDKGILVVIRNDTEENKIREDLLTMNEQLQLQNTIMAEVKKMAKIGSYSWHIKTDTAEISDNFYRILGYEPHEFEPSFETYRKLVHPDDLQLYEELMGQVAETRKPPEHTYRVITKTGRTISLRTKGQFLKINGKEVMVGVVQDVTDQIDAENVLRARNLALDRSNAELEAFNRVASHDLQEPLRKIQMFISRLDETEKNQLSEKGKNYFKKVNAAAARMQSLIHNLLAYSSIDSTQEDFEEVDLNLVLEKVQEDFRERIINTKASISSEKLPKVQGVFFQMEQLFSNLIANALKYRDPKLAPKIVLKSEKVRHEQIPEDFIKVAKHYYKLTLIDNGIGFADENADKIFEVFQRLHQKSEYSGTGIGLAICKKIVETHHGFIHATGKLGKGAAFIIYLPA